MPIVRPITPPINRAEIADTTVTMIKIARAGATPEQILTPGRQEMTALVIVELTTTGAENTR